MKVNEVMTSDADFCFADDNLTKAAFIMWSRDCGIVPVVDAKNRPIGVITDRDICIAVASRNRTTSDIRACEMNFAPLKVCSPDDDVKDVLRRMRKYKIKRLCVTNNEHVLVGMISLTDIVLKAGEKKSIRKLVLSTISAIAKPLPIVLKAAVEDEVEEVATETDEAEAENATEATDES
jgi:CBS domain-containing protein